MGLVDNLKFDAENTYRAAESLFKLVDNDKLDWKPATGKNWMTTGQLLKHCTSACGGVSRGFVTGDWSGAGGGDSDEGGGMPTAEKMPTVASVDEALKLLAADKDVALKTFAEAGEERLANEKVSAPWGGPPVALYHHLNDMVGHLGQHKAQLFYYLKLQGKDVNTMHLWGVA
ncbi:MAG: DinB family protein, partial [Planctomycetes bacterium]|nr:DinB family protein [Planctomycetota bacterium]